MTPKGIGLYARTLSVPTHGTPAQMAKRCRDVGVSFVAFLGCWQDKSGPGRTLKQRVPDAKQTRGYVEALKNAGVEVWLWGFPWLDHELTYMEAMRAVAVGVGGVRGFIHDPEVSYRDRAIARADKASRGQGEAVDAQPEGTALSTARAAQNLLTLDAQAIADLKLAPSGITSYGMADWHPLPWRQLAADGRVWGSPQLYTVTPKQVDQGLASWRAKGFSTLLPSVPTYGENAGANLDAHLARFVDGGGEPTIDGFLIWSWQQTGGVEWKTLAKWAEMLRSRACTNETKGNAP